MSKRAIRAGAASMLLCGAQAAPAQDAPRLFADLLAAIETRDAGAIAALSQNDIMLMRGYVFLSADGLLEQIAGCTVTSTRAPQGQTDLGRIDLACAERHNRIAPDSCDSGDLVLTGYLIEGRMRLNLDEARAKTEACPPPAPPPPWSPSPNR